MDILWLCVGLINQHFCLDFHFRELSFVKRQQFCLYFHFYILSFGKRTCILIYQIEQTIICLDFLIVVWSLRCLLILANRVRLRLGFLIFHWCHFAIRGLLAPNILVFGTMLTSAIRKLFSTLARSLNPRNVNHGNSWNSLFRLPYPQSNRIRILIF